ncbi:hypothetical protein BJ322DRAFT_355345 [Thelephora terrestris]|uniref:Uncharacterized protein n=1 Tax=Thelephora terrestris TaxID=56493 RepID=A0A9P6L1R4_9AGAM|nr:hypothetical protein BJ322DRAFT_355345 [Thelephora terrestris]
MTKLPSTIKQLLKLRNPNPPLQPPIPNLNGVLSSTLIDAKRKNAQTAWLVLATCTLLTANLPTSVGHLYSFATRKDPADVSTRYGLERAVNTAALMRESAFKSTVFVGVPRVILSLAEFTNALEDDVKARLPKTLSRTKDMDTIVAHGRILWNSIYEPYEDKLHDKLSSCHPDFMAFIIQAYGSALSPFSVNSDVSRGFSRGDGSGVDDRGRGGGSEPASSSQQLSSTPSSTTSYTRSFFAGSGTSTDERGNLSRALTSVVGSACLRAEGGVGPQLTSHVFGLLKARTAEDQGYEMNEEDRWLATDEGTEWVIKTVDSILDVVAPAQNHPGPETKAKL